MADAPHSDDPYTIPETAYRYKLDHVHDFDGVNKNFDEVSEAITMLMHNMAEQNKQTNENIVQLAQETSRNLNKLASDLKAVLSSQAMMCVLFLTVLGLIVLAAKAIWDSIMGPIMY